MSWAKWAVALGLATAAAEAGLVAAAVPHFTDTLPTGLMPVCFLAGGPLFLALVAWRRRLDPTTGRWLVRLAGVLAVAGPGVLAYHLYPVGNAPPADFTPTAVALGQWAAVLIGWVVMGMVKRARHLLV